MLYIKVNQGDIAFYSFLLDLFLADLIKHLTTDLSAATRPVFFLLEEFGQLKIDNFPVYIATARKYQVGFWVFLQSWAQLEEQYGPQNARTIRSNFSTQLYFGGIELDTAQTLEQRIGLTKVRTRKDQDYQHHQEPLLSAREIIEQPDNSCLVLHSNRPAFQLPGTPYDQQAGLRRHSQHPAPAVRRYTHTAAQYFILWVYCWIDAHYPSLTNLRERRSCGFPPQLSDIAVEVLTMEVIGEYQRLDTDVQIWHYFKRHWPNHFPRLGSRSQFVKQASNLWAIKQALHQRLTQQLGAISDPVHIVDGFPMPLCEFNRAGNGRSFKGQAQYGYCASKDKTYYGLKDHVVIDMNGTIVLPVPRRVNRKPVLSCSVRCTGCCWEIRDTWD